MDSPKYLSVSVCKCGHLQVVHEYVSFHGIEEYGPCSACGCQVFA